jgi:hypothetical protein
MMANCSLLSGQQKKQIMKWTKKGNWKLLYRGSRDGFEASSFHEKCDKKGETVVIINSNGQLFGGYTPNSWNSSGGHLADDSLKSFIFTLTNILL